MEFFQPPPKRDEPKHEPAEWSQPGPNVLGGLVSWRFVLAENERARIVLRDVVAYANGITLVVGVRVHDGDDHYLFHRMAHPRHDLSDEFLRFGVELADGRKLTNLDERVGGRDSAVLWSSGGGGGGKRYEWRYWLWPLPPPGPLTFVCEWPAFDIPLTRVQVDTREAHDAARRARVVWQDA